MERELDTVIGPASTDGNGQGRMLMSVTEVRGTPTFGAAAGVAAQPLPFAPLAAGDTRGRVGRLLAGGSGSAQVQRALVAADAAAVVAAVGVAIALASPDERLLAQLAWSVLYLPVFLVLFKAYGLYDGDRRRVGHSTFDDVPGVFHGALIGTIGLWAFLKATPADRMVLAQAALLLALTIVVVLVGRAVARRLVARVTAPERVLLVGAGPSAESLVRKTRAHRGRGLRAVGFVCEDGHDGALPEHELPRLGAPRELRAVCLSHGVERIMIASPDLSPEVVTDAIREAHHARVKVTLLPSVTDVLGPSTEVDELVGVTVLAVNPPNLSASSRLFKRGLDVLLSSAALVAMLPLLPLVAAAIRLDSPGPVFFRQRRLGRGGRHFQMIKLRTMVQDAEAQADRLRAHSAHPAWLLLDRDPRITRLGRLLRLTSIDELPQFWNVLRGEMSLVGPRPMPPTTDEHIVGWARRRLDLTPGITGMWQVLGRASLSFEEMIKLDYLYVTNWSVWRDVRLLIRTVSVVLSRRGAN
jgi:exopolysaccharide biosynthesis polyprenyl glycosylphosphotransferase